MFCSRKEDTLCRISLVDILAWKSTAEIQMQDEHPLTFEQATSVLYQTDSFSDFLSLLREFIRPYQTPWLAHLELQENKRGLEFL